MNDEWAGKIQVKQVSEDSLGAGITRCDLQPATGELWEVIAARGYHDDDHAARNVLWYAHDAVTEIQLWSEANLANATYRDLYSTAIVCGKPIVLNEVTHLSFAGVDVTAGHKVWIDALVRVISGVPLWANT